MEKISVITTTMLMNQIVEGARHYIKALQNDKEFHVVKDIRRKINNMVAALELLSKKLPDNITQML